MTRTLGLGLGLGLKLLEKDGGQEDVGVRASDGVRAMRVGTRVRIRVRGLGLGLGPG